MFTYQTETFSMYFRSEIVPIKENGVPNNQSKLPLVPLFGFRI